MTEKIALVGIGEIARSQHLPAIAASQHWELAAIVSRASQLDGIDHFSTIDAFLDARPDVTTVSLCVPPAPRFDIASAAISRGRHVMLEKPPGSTVSECKALQSLAEHAGVTLFATWHSREAATLDQCEAWLTDKTVTAFTITWKEDVHQWHPGQEWLWEPGGMGVFDPGINALSILSKILPEPVTVTGALLEIPANKQTPIAAKVALRTLSGAKGHAELDWKHKGEPVWAIAVATTAGNLEIYEGGAQATIDGERKQSTNSDTTLAEEYPRLYQRMQQLVASRSSDCDFEPLQLVADIFMLGKRQSVEEFHF